jgi:hypothetical protein
MVDNPDLMLPTNDLSSYIEAPEPSTREFTENPTFQEGSEVLRFPKTCLQSWRPESIRT